MCGTLASLLVLFARFSREVIEIQYNLYCHCGLQVCLFIWPESRRVCFAEFKQSFFLAPAAASIYQPKAQWLRDLCLYELRAMNLQLKCLPKKCEIV